MAELLFWPALLAYGEAAIAYAGDARRPGRLGALATWGVRLGWLAQTALLAYQVADTSDFPWATWAGALNLFVWFVVSAYLIWGCRPRYRLLGLAVMPPAAALLALAYAGGGIGPERSGGPALFLAVHVGAMLAAFAGFALAAALSALYLWHEGRLKRREASILRVAVPPLESLDVLAARTIAVSLAALTVGIVVGLARLRAGHGSFDGAMVATLVAWGAYAIALALRYGVGLRGRRAARLGVAGFALVTIVLGVSHFG